MCVRFAFLLHNFLILNLDEDRLECFDTGSYSCELIKSSE